MLRLDELQNNFKGKLALNEMMSKHTSFCIGGPADLYAEPNDKNDSLALLSFLQEQNISFTILGNGSNVLISDDGLRGVVINLESGMNTISYENAKHPPLEDNFVIVESGVMLNRFVDFCIQRELKGVEMLAGIPGTIGGAIRMNAGAHGGEISDFIFDVEVIREKQFQTISKEEAQFKYRSSGLRKDDVVVGARFQFPMGNKEEMIVMRKEMLKKRNATQPLDLPNSGSVFKNPKPQYAAKLIEECGIKGMRIGNAAISEKHANFIVNLGGAKANDVLSLMKLAKKTVKEKCNVDLELEVKLMGFREEELVGVYS
ncbi:MAG: UDP-N-acetylmuramate dehydrogenase [Ignavibacteriales bacterium]|nr:UDP-N-acetylmuramate dehydrogenase [Ignavibacteriales bacterium]